MLTNLAVEALSRRIAAVGALASLPSTNPHQRRVYQARLRELNARLRRAVVGGVG